MSRTLRANLLLLVTAAIWGSAFVAQWLGAEETGPASFNAARNLLGSLALLPVVIGFDRVGKVGREQRRTLWRQAWKPGVLAGSVLTGGTLLQQAGLEYTTAGNASFITGLYLVFIPLASVLLRVRTSGWTCVAVVLALAGLYLLSIREGLHINTGDLLALVFETHPFSGLVEAAVPLAYTAFLSTGVGFTLQAIAQRDAKAAHAAIIMSLETVFGAVAGVLWLAERMDLRGVTGCALMLAAVIVAQLGNLPKPQPGESADQG